MSKKYIIIALVILVVVAGAFALLGKKSRQPAALTPEAQELENQVAPGITKGETYPESETHTSVGSDVKVPDASSAVSAGVAAPKTVAAAAEGSDLKSRTFEITINNNSFSPSTVIIGQGDIASITFKSVDKDYDFVQPDYGLSMKLPKGTPRMINFQGVATGKYTFYCATCGGPSKGPVGYIVVVPR